RRHSYTTHIPYTTLFRSGFEAEQSQHERRRRHEAHRLTEGWTIIRQRNAAGRGKRQHQAHGDRISRHHLDVPRRKSAAVAAPPRDRKSTRLNASHVKSSY